MIERADDGVVERSAAARVNAFESFFELRDAAGEILVEIEVVVFLEAINEFAAIIEDGGVKDDQADVNFDGAALLVDVLIGRKRPGVGERERIILRDGGG